MDQPVTQDHRLLKTIVITLGVLIVIGFAALIAGLIAQAGKLEGEATAKPVLLPHDGRIADIAVGEANIVLRIETGEGDILFLIDQKTGAVIRKIPIAREDGGGDSR